MTTPAEEDDPRWQMYKELSRSSGGTNPGSAAAVAELMRKVRLPSWQPPKPVTLPSWRPAVAKHGGQYLGHIKQKKVSWKWWFPGCLQLVLWIGSARQGYGAAKKSAQKWEGKTGGKGKPGKGQHKGKGGRRMNRSSGCTTARGKGGSAAVAALR